MLTQQDEELYMKFCQIRKVQLIQSFPALPTEEVAKVIAMDWSKLNGEQRHNFVNQYQDVLSGGGPQVPVIKAEMPTAMMHIPPQ